MRVRKRSLRTTLTVWNAVALTVLLGAFGAALVFTNQNRLRASIDDDLVRQAERAARGGPPAPPPRVGMGNGQYGQPAPFEEPNPPPGAMGGAYDGPRNGPGNGRNGFGAGPGAGPGVPGGAGGIGPGADGPRGPDPFMEAQRLADVRRPRFFDRERRPMNPGESVPPFDEEALAESLLGRGVFRDTKANGEAVRVYSQPIVRGGTVVGAVQFARELREVDLLWATQMRTLLLLLPLTVLVAAGGAYVFANRALKPIAQVTKAAAEISRSDLSRRLQVTGDDELAELGRTFNEMLGRLDRSFSELEGAYAHLAQAYEQQQRFTADASHELRTPLTRLKLATSAALAESTSPEEMRQALTAADRAATSMTRLVQQLLMLARADAGELGLRMEPVDLRVVVAEALEGLSIGRPVDSAFADRPVMIRGDAENIGRVITNLVENAARHTPPEGTLRVETTRNGDEAVVTVRDTGEGISAEHLPHLFDRFYRVDGARTRKDGGSGLGLAICKNLVEAHGGRLEIESSPGVGTTARAVFPLFSEPMPPQTISS